MVIVAYLDRGPIRRYGGYGSPYGRRPSKPQANAMLDASHLGLILPAFLVAGAVKGMIGLGLPSVAMGLMALMLTPAQAAALLVMPSFVTNLWQMLAGPALGGLVRRLWSMLVATSIGTWATASLLTSSASGVATFGLGLSLAAYALFGLAGRPLVVAPRQEWWLSPGAGLVTGMITGATGTFVIPVVPYLQSLGLSRDELVQALGLSFTVSTLAMATALWRLGAFEGETAGASALAVLPAVLGMAAGQWLRGRIDQATFRRWFFAGMLLVGAHLAFKGLTG